MAWSGGLFVNYSNSPFVLRSCVSKTDCSSPNAVNSTDVKVIETMVTGDLMASLTPIPKLQLGLRVPMTFVSGDGVELDPANVNYGRGKEGGLSGAGLGDATVEAKFRAYGEPTDTVVAGVALFLTGPTGHATAKDKYIGDGTPTVGLRGIFDGKSGPFSFAANLAGMYRGTGKVGSTELGSEFRYGVAGGYQVSPLIRAIVEGFGGTKFQSQNGTNSLEVDLAAQITPLQSGANIFLGGGPGVIQGVGVPSFRGFVGFMYVHETGDSDGDGIADSSDKCPNDPEDKDGFEDSDGCPEDDNDGDGIKDKQDKCPNDPETMNGFEDLDGCPDEMPDADKDGIPDPDDKCPDEGGPNVIRAKGDFYGCPDRDGDGIPDKIDKCPDQPEDTDGFQDTDGCPDPDNDGDGVLDASDECVDQPGTLPNGCPDPDTDNDGIPDSKDKCPKEPETYNGYQDQDGCPDKAPASMVQVSGDQIKILKQVQFATGSDKITGAESFKILDQVAEVINSDQRIFLIEVAGHTDDVGDPAANKALSQKRAEAVVKYMVDKRKVDAKKLKAAGYGSEKPLDAAKTKDARQKNRRVEFNIVNSGAKKPEATP